MAIVPHYTTIFSSDQYHLLEQLQCEEFIFRNLCSLKLNIAARESFPSFKSHITNVFCMALCGSSIEEIDISNVNLDELEGLLRERIPDNMAPSFKIPSSSRLKRLKLKDTFIHERHISSKSLFSRFCFQRLRSLKITWKVDNPLTFPVWTQLIASCPALQELKFTNLNFDRPTFNSAVESHLSISTSLPKLSNLISLKLSYPTYGISNLKIYAEYYRILQSSLPKLSLLNLKGVVFNRRWDPAQNPCLQRGM
ncbi:hypothetical protein BKA69DRAFT_1167728 [Paraphysoderma sedebokerense]|nr:hypothetical protein BKA69DRAFT_1167728 [Paraphysoderma sedebokerense]